MFPVTVLSKDDCLFGRDDHWPIKGSRQRHREFTDIQALRGGGKALLLPYCEGRRRSMGSPARSILEITTHSSRRQSVKFVKEGLPRVSYLTLWRVPRVGKHSRKQKMPYISSYMGHYEDTNEINLYHHQLAFCSTRKVGEVIHADSRSYDLQPLNCEFFLP